MVREKSPRLHNDRFGLRLRERSPVDSLRHPACGGFADAPGDTSEIESPYGGLLTQGAVLRVTSNGTTTSPVIRGAWIMSRIMGEPPPPPPPSVPPSSRIFAARKPSAISWRCTRNRRPARPVTPVFDPVGLALENFDIMGAWRDRYRGLEKGERVTGIDRAGPRFRLLPWPTRSDSAGTLLDGRSFQNIADLKAILAANPRQLARNLLRQFTVYATGSPVRYSDRSEIEAILDECRPSRYRVRDLLRGIVRSRIFLGQPGCLSSAIPRTLRPMNSPHIYSSSSASGAAPSCAASASVSRCRSWSACGRSSPAPLSRPRPAACWPSRIISACSPSASSPRPPAPATHSRPTLRISRCSGRFHRHQRPLASRRRGRPLHRELFSHRGPGADQQRLSQPDFARSVRRRKAWPAHALSPV